MIARRGFLGAILAAGIAPAFVRAGVLMPVKEIWVPPQGISDPTMSAKDYVARWAEDDSFYRGPLHEMEIGRIETSRFIESPNYHRVMRPLGKSKPKAPDGEYFAFVHSDRAREYPFA